MAPWFGDRESRVIHAGRAHTMGDTGMWLPNEKVLFAARHGRVRRRPPSGLQAAAHACRTPSRNWRVGMSLPARWSIPGGCRARRCGAGRVHAGRASGDRRQAAGGAGNGCAGIVGLLARADRRRVHVADFRRGGARSARGHRPCRSRVEGRGRANLRREPPCRDPAVPRPARRCALAPS